MLTTFWAGQWKEPWGETDSEIVENNYDVVFYFEQRKEVLRLQAFFFFFKSGLIEREFEMEMGLLVGARENTMESLSASL